MLPFLLVFPLLTLIISCPYFIVPFIVSRNPFHFISINIADFFITQVSRLILNLLEANCPLDESIYSNTSENFSFQHPESNRDTESNTSRGAERETSLGDEIWEEERWWIGHSVLYDVGYWWNMICCFVCSSSSAWSTSCDEQSKPRMEGD